MNFLSTSGQGFKQRIFSYCSCLFTIAVLIGGILLFVPGSGFSQDLSQRYIVDSETGLPSSKDGQSDTQIPANQPHLLKGSFCSWSGSSSSSGSYSTSKWAKFDGVGRFIYGSSSSYSGNQGSAYNGSPKHGGAYEVRGKYIYLRYNDGGCDVAKVYNRASNGMITEVMFEGTLYAAALCD